MEQLIPSPRSSMDSTESTAASTVSNGAPAPAPGAAPAPAPGAAPAPVIDCDFDDVPEVVGWMSSMVDRGGRGRKETESHRLFLARRTALEMLGDRGYGVPESELARTLPEFRAWWAQMPNIERLAFTAARTSDLSNKAQILFCPPDTLRLAAIREIYDQTKQDNLSRLILVLQGKIMSRARESIKEMFTCKVDIFQITELLVNITKHVLKPKHEVLTAEEKAKLLKEYNVEDSRLPRMLETDAVARYYGLGKGTVVKVTSDCDLTGNHVTYRCIF